MIDRTYRVNDVVKSEFLRLPLALIANPKYKQMSLEAKFIYSLLLNRMTLEPPVRRREEDNSLITFMCICNGCAKLLVG